MFHHDERTLHPIADVESFGQAVTGNRSAKPLPEVSKTSSDSVHNETKFNESPSYRDGQHTCRLVRKETNTSLAAQRSVPAISLQSGPLNSSM